MLKRENTLLRAVFFDANQTWSQIYQNAELGCVLPPEEWGPPVISRGNNLEPPMSALGQKQTPP
jgi:hypothetical protein